MCRMRAPGRIAATAGSHIQVCRLLSRSHRLPATSVVRASARYSRCMRSASSGRSIPSPRGQAPRCVSMLPIPTSPSYSPIPATSGWRSSICSMSVVPLRGMPATMATPSTSGTRGVNQALPRSSSCRWSAMFSRKAKSSKATPVAPWMKAARSNARRYSPAASRSCTASNAALRRMASGPVARAIDSSSAIAPGRSAAARARAARIRPRTSLSQGPPASTSARISSRRPLRCRMSTRKQCASTEFGALAAMSAFSRSTARALRPR